MKQLFWWGYYDRCAQTPTSNKVTVTKDFDFKNFDSEAFDLNP